MQNSATGTTVAWCAVHHHQPEYRHGRIEPGRSILSPPPDVRGGIRKGVDSRKGTSWIEVVTARTTAPEGWARKPIAVLERIYQWDGPGVCSTGNGLQHSAPTVSAIAGLPHGWAWEMGQYGESSGHRRPEQNRAKPCNRDSMGKPRSTGLPGSQDGPPNLQGCGAKRKPQTRAEIHRAIRKELATLARKLARDPSRRVRLRSHLPETCGPVSYGPAPTQTTTAGKARAG